MDVIEATRDELDSRAAAELLGCSPPTICRLVEEGVLPARRLTPRGRSRLRFRRDDVERVLAAVVLVDGELAA